MTSTTLLIGFVYTYMCVSKSDNREIIINDKADEVIEKLLKSFLDKHQSSLGTSNKSNDFVFDWVHL